MITIERNFDVVTDNQDLELLHTFKDFPVFMGCIDQPQDQDLVSDLNVYISASSGMIQINPVIKLELVYQTEHNPGTTGQGWINHHRAFAGFISKYQPKKVFEIGGAHGILSQSYMETHFDVDWTILEPNPIPVEGLKASMQKGFFTEDTVVPEGTDMIIHSHVLEHVYEPKKFFNNLSKLPKGTKMCISVPALKQHLQQQFTNTINFEHTYFCTEEFIEWYLGCYGFDLLDRQYYDVDHSVFYAVVRSDREPHFWSHPEAYQDNKVLFDTYVEYHQQLIRNFNQKMSEALGPIYLFGGHAFSQFLLAFGLDRSKITCIIDNDPGKQGKRLYGTDLMVQSPSILLQDSTPTVVLRTGVFNEEIKLDICKNVNPNTQFLE